MKLVGSSMSPYVRRLRLFLEGKAFEFINLNIYSPEGREALARYTPAMKIPVLVDGEQTIYDSRAIHRYLVSTHFPETPMSWHQENLLSLIDAANDSYVILLLSKRSGIDTDADMLIANLQKERIERTLQLLEKSVASGELADWNYPAMCLFCLLDWISFRELEDLSRYAALNTFHQQHLTSPGVNDSDPRLVDA